MRVLFFGDVVGKTGRNAVAKSLPILREKHKPDLVIANAENLAHGKGLTLSTFNFMIETGVDFFTTGNHVFDKPEAKEVFQKYPDKIIRPANFSDDLPGQGSALLDIQGVSVLIINLNGQVFMEKQFDYGQIANPFEKLNQILESIGPRAKVKILDFHAEATSEKRGMGFWADGRVSVVLGTHTHVATADTQILPFGTGYQTDVGMVGAADSIIGVNREGALKKLLADPTNLEKISLEVADSDQYEVSYAFFEIDEGSGKCKNIKGHLLRI